MPSLRKDREAAVDTLTKEFDGLQGLVVAGYVGVKTQELNELRGKLRPAQSAMPDREKSVGENCVKNKGIDAGFGDFFKGPVGADHSKRRRGCRIESAGGI
jgi:ribosomal protein L10